MKISPMCKVIEMTRNVVARVKRGSTPQSIKMFRMSISESIFRMILKDGMPLQRMKKFRKS